MLKAVVEKNHIRTFFFFNGENLPDSAHPVFIDHHQCLREFLFDLQRFISYVAHLRVGADNHEAVGFTFVSPAEYRHLELWR
ncbi:hypothetical protein SDC9_153398 [bioreactor metagenome]|uniref:Uncharacterized protein n=1 Tax=bioreactor metagenome TaxID=1076179 RepID=A0A645EY17_9ZZZZ